MTNDTNKNVTYFANIDNSRYAKETKTTHLPYTGAAVILEKSYRWKRNTYTYGIITKVMKTYFIVKWENGQEERCTPNGLPYSQRGRYNSEHIEVMKVRDESKCFLPAYKLRINVKVGELDIAQKLISAHKEMVQEQLDKDEKRDNEIQEARDLLNAMNEKIEMMRHACGHNNLKLVHDNNAKEKFENIMSSLEELTTYMKATN